MGNLPFGSFSTPTTPIQTLIQTPPGYTGGVDLAPSELTGRTAQELQSTLVSGGGLDPNQVARSPQELIKAYGTPSGTEPGYMDLIKKAGSFEDIPLSERFNAVKDLSSQALKDVFYNPVRDSSGKIIDYNLDKKTLFATIAGASSYYEALQLAKKAGIPEGEFSEADYQRLKVDPEKSKFTSLKPENFGIRPTVAGGGLMNEGVLSIKLTPAQAMAMGGRMGYADGSPLAGLAIKLIRPVQSGDPVGSYYVGEGGGGMGTLIKQLIQQNPNMFQQQARAVSTNPVNDLYKYYLENSTDEDYKRRIMESVKPRFGVAMGGEIPVRQNQGGVSELDLRAKGGYIPVGIKEKADDVPAMLSRNEFVFTADAVRGAGNGSINKGAQKMYKLMKSLEKKVKKMKKVA
jgi:hypothetical protein